MAEMSAFWRDNEPNPIEGKLINNNDVYSVVDYTIAGLTVSVTTLHKGKATRGHSHPHAEAYFFKTDAGIRLGHTHYEVKAGQLLMVKPKQFHRVYAMPDKESVFVCVFNGLRNETERDYTPPKVY